MAVDKCKLCHATPCHCRAIEDHVNWLLANPAEFFPGYDPGKFPWQIANALRRRVLAAASAERKRCADYVRRGCYCGCRTPKYRSSPDCHQRFLGELADELEWLDT